MGRVPSFQFLVAHPVQLQLLVAVCQTASLVFENLVLVCRQQLFEQVVCRQLLFEKVVQLVV